MASKGKVAVGISGGVDSAVSAALLVERGYEVTGVFLECWKEPGCRTDEDRKDALAVALKLGIPFKILDFRQAYRQKVVDYFYAEYKAGRTPNPDVMCNKEIKFGLFYDWCLENGFDYVATGHYARIEDGELLRGVDEKKDQTYFLYRLRPEQLKQILFPIGELTKTEVRREARRRGLPVADKPDSQGICFIGEVNIQEFLRQRLPVKRGEVVDAKGNVIGEHEGVWFYTIGQRGGWRVNPSYQKQFGGESPAMYVVDKDVKTNQLIVGFGAETYRDQFEVKDLNWIAENYESRITDKELKVRIRHGGKLVPAKFIIHNSLFMIHLSEPQRGIAPGQSAVFYRGKVCLGGGVIN